MGIPVAVAILAITAVTLVTLWTLLYQVVKQQGRILLRLDALEQRLAQAGAGGNGAHAPNAPPPGLAVGTVAPDFTYPDLSGTPVSLSDFKGKHVLLVHWSPNCGYCDMIAGDLAKLHPGLQKQKTELLLLSYGDAESNRRFAEKHGLTCPILLVGDKTPEAFSNFGTPVAYLIDKEGKVARALSIGADQVPGLAREIAEGKRVRLRLPGERPLSESTIERNGLPPGTRAPDFRLDDINGHSVGLEDFRGRRVLLVFSDPVCGPCDALAPHLVNLHREHQQNHLALLYVGRGDLEENRRKARESGFEFPVVVQKHWELSKKYGIFATPVGFLIREDGVIERGVAKGGDEILALAREVLAHEQASPTAS